MKLCLGVQELLEDDLKFAAQLGVTHLKLMGGDFLDEQRRGPLQPDRFLKAKERIEAHGLKVGVVLLPQEPGSQFWNVRLGRPGRDGEIEDVCRTIGLLGKLGVPVVEYVFNVVGCWGYSGKGNTWGRGEAIITHFDYGTCKGAPAEPGQEASAEEMWDRLTYFLERVVPAAEAAEVRLACHPSDPPVPRLRGEERILASIADLKRLIEIVPSEANGLNFCQGTVAEMGADVIEAIHYFGSRDKINHVHFRNVRGRVPCYDEVFIDEGDTDMLEAMRAYKEVGYTGTLMPDHTPRIAGDTPYGHRGRAYALGYIKALMHAVGM